MRAPSGEWVSSSVLRTAFSVNSCVCCGAFVHLLFLNGCVYVRCLFDQNTIHNKRQSPPVPPEKRLRHKSARTSVTRPTPQQQQQQKTQNAFAQNTRKKYANTCSISNRWTVADQRHHNIAVNALRTKYTFSSNHTPNLLLAGLVVRSISDTQSVESAKQPTKINHGTESVPNSQ